MGNPLQNRPNWAAAVLVGFCLILGGQTLPFLWPADQKLVTASEKDNKSKISLPKDSVLIVRLDVKPGTGFRWHISHCDQNRLELLGEPVFEASGQPASGSSEQQVFRFRTRTAGSSVLEMVYRRAWEKDVPPVKKFNITVMTQ